MSKRDVTTVGLIFALTCTTSLPLLAQADPGWIGKRVMPRNSKFTLLVNGEEVECGGTGVEVYRVEQIDGPSLLLKAEVRGLSGWTTADQVVRVDLAVDFFTEQVRVHPENAFFRAARALLWSDRKAFENALRDYDEAVRLDPKNASYHRGRGQLWQLKNEYDRAIADFDEAIRLEPKSASAFIGRGAAWASKKQYGKAIADDSEAIWLDPVAIAAYDNRGLAWHARGEFAKAIVDYNVALRLDSRHALALCHRGNAWAALNKFDTALADYDAAIQIDEKCARAHGSRAWLWSTCSNGRYRDGKKAVASATRACELTEWNDPAMLEVLAAAHAETGDFEAAARWQTKANALRQNGTEKVTGEFRLKLFEQKKPLRDPDG